MSDRLKKIAAYRAAEDDKTEMKKIQLEGKGNLLKEQIKALKPRIKELLDVANECVSNGITIDAHGKNRGSCDDTYEKGTFVTNGITHRVGFVKDWTSRDAVQKFRYVGFDNGGACGCYDFQTDGVVIEERHETTDAFREPTIEHMQKFLDKFCEFERAFYQYIDGVVGVRDDTYVYVPAYDKTFNALISITPKSNVIMDRGGEKETYVIRYMDSEWFLCSPENSDKCYDVGYSNMLDLIGTLIRDYAAGVFASCEVLN